MRCAAIICAIVFIVVVVGIIVLLVLLLPRTAQFRATSMKKCEDFPKDRQTCEKLLSTFEGAYVGKDPCNISETNYNKVIDQSPFTHSAYRTMFWSKIHDLPHEYTKKSKCFGNLEDTLLGSVLDGESWCGKEGSKEHGEGEVTAMLNGDESEPYDPTSVFARKEVPNLRSGVVTRLNVVLVTNTGDCNQPSLQNLRNDLNNRRIGYTCKVVTRSNITECINTNKPCGGCW